jgi:hypothetical protein
MTDFKNTADEPGVTLGFFGGVLYNSSSTLPSVRGTIRSQTAATAETAPSLKTPTVEGLETKAGRPRAVTKDGAVMRG